MSKKITGGTGNVFEDLGFKEPEEYRAKAELALQISKIIVKGFYLMTPTFFINSFCTEFLPDITEPVLNVL